MNIDLLFCSDYQFAMHALASAEEGFQPRRYSGFEIHPKLIRELVTRYSGMTGMSQSDLLALRLMLI